MWDILKDKEISSYNKLEFIKFADTVFGLNLLTKDVKKEEEISSEIKELLEKRAQARKDKDFKTSDILRDELKQKGILVKDTSSGQTWEKI